MSLPLTSRSLVRGFASLEARRRSLWIETAGRSPLGPAYEGGPGLLDTFVQGFLRSSMLCLAVCSPSRSLPLRRRTPVRVYKMGSLEAALPRRVGRACRSHSTEVAVEALRDHLREQRRVADEDFHFGPGTARSTPAPRRTADLPHAELGASPPPVAANALSHRSEALIERAERRFGPTLRDPFGNQSC